MHDGGTENRRRKEQDSAASSTEADTPCVDNTGHQRYQQLDDAVGVGGIEEVCVVIDSLGVQAAQRARLYSLIEGGQTSVGAERRRFIEESHGIQLCIMSTSNSFQHYSYNLND